MERMENVNGVEHDVKFHTPGCLSGGNPLVNVPF